MRLDNDRIEIMPAFLKFVIRRLFYALASMIVITMVLYAGIMLTPPEARARLYLPPGKGGDRATEQTIRVIIRDHYLDDPYLVQYWYWIKSLLTGSWGYSHTLREDVLTALLRRTPVTLELAMISLSLLIPIGFISGLIAGWRPGEIFDSGFRVLAFLGTSMPPLIFSMMMLSIFYVKLGWFPPGRLDVMTGLDLSQSGFVEYTGALTVDTLLNRRFDVFLVALRHLAMPVLTLSMYYWATLGRITRAAILTERNKEYIIAARARGVRDSRLLWHHTLRVTLAPSLTIMALSAASIVTGIFVIEIIFNLPGISEVIVTSMKTVPDAPAALGFAIYSVIMVLGLMFILDIFQAIIDPRVREEILRS
jgi:peptide/nickel transport system permease protein